MTRKTGRISTTKSRTRSSTLKGRTSHRKGGRNVPRSAQIVGLQPRPRPDPGLRTWPADVVQIVASTQATVNVNGIRGKIVDQICADCHGRLAVDSHTIKTAWEMPERCGRPLKFICVDCCVSLYDRASITHLIDLRSKDVP